jgi:hypothetical protein
MADLPSHLKAAQDKFRPRMDAQTQRMAHLQEAALAQELAEAVPVDERAAEDVVAALGEEIAKH